MALTPKQQRFVDEYLKHFNATRAAVDAGYSPKTAYNTGWENVRKHEIAEVIKQRLAESAMSADEVLMRLAQHGRADIGQWLTDDGYIDIAAMKRDKVTHLIHEVERTERSGETKEGGAWSHVTAKVKLHPAQSALSLLGKHHGLFKDIVESKSQVELGLDEESRQVLNRIDSVAARLRASGDSEGDRANDAGKGAA